MSASRLRPGAVLTPGQFRAACAAMLMTILLSALDQTIVSVAVPTIARQLGGFEWMAWVVSGYLIASTAVTPLYGKLSDLIGRRRVMILAIGIFLVASVGCAVARSLPELVIARVLQGAGGGGLIATAQSVIADVVPLRERGRYQSYVSVVWALASLLGPLVGGVLTEYLSWPWIFWINLPVGLLALWLVQGSLRALPVHRSASRIDVLGAFLLLMGLTALLIPITRVGQGADWGDSFNLVGIGTAAALLCGFVVQQRRHPQPILPMSLMTQRTVVAACGLLFLCFFNFVALSVLVPLRLQLTAGLSATDAGLGLLPLTLSIPCAAFLGGRWLSHSGRVLTMERIGVALVPAAMVLLSFSAPSGPVAVLALVALGSGMGLQMPTTLISVQQSVARDQIGTVTALTSFFRQLGGAIGIAVLSSVVLLKLHGAGPTAHPLGDPQAVGHWFAAAPGGTTTPGSDDHAFRFALRLGAAVAALGWWCVSRMPDLRLNDAPAHGLPS